MFRWLHNLGGMGAFAAIGAIAAAIGIVRGLIEGDMSFVVVACFFLGINILIVVLEYKKRKERKSSP